MFSSILIYKDFTVYFSMLINDITFGNRWERKEKTIKRIDDKLKNGKSTKGK